MEEEEAEEEEEEEAEEEEEEERMGGGGQTFWFWLVVKFGISDEFLHTKNWGPSLFEFLVFTSSR